MDLQMEQLKKEYLKFKTMSTITEIKNIWSTLTTLKRRVDCACSKPTVPPLPTANGSYLLNVVDGVYTWTLA